MDQDVRDLAIAPFQEIVDKGNVALENATAGENADMIKAAKTLVREGERALKKLEPLCKKHLEEYSSNFVDALKENDDIAQFRTDLNELLWEFEDYVEVDEFEADKFAELQALSRKAAPKILDILMRMRLEPPAISPLPTPSEAPLPALTPPLSHASSNPFDDFNSGRSDVTGTGSYRDSMTPSLGRQSAVDSIATLRNMMKAESGPDLGLDGGMTRQSAHVEPLALLPRTDSLPPRAATAGEGLRKDSEQQQAQLIQQALQIQHDQKVQQAQVVQQNLQQAESQRTVPETSDAVSIPEEAPPEPETNPWLMEVRPSVGDILEGLDRMSMKEGETEIERRERMPVLTDSPTLPAKRMPDLQMTKDETPTMVQCEVTYTREPTRMESYDTLTAEEPSPWTKVAVPSTTAASSRIPVPPVYEQPLRRMTSGPEPSTSSNFAREYLPHSQSSSNIMQKPLPQYPQPHPRDAYSWPQGQGQGLSISPGTQQYHSPTKASISNSDGNGARSISLSSDGGASPHNSSVGGQIHPYFRTPSYEPISPISASQRSTLSPASVASQPVHPAYHAAKPSETSGLIIPEESEATSLYSTNDYPEVVQDENTEEMPLIDQPGLIPVQIENSHVEPPIIPARPIDCSIGPRSSFYILKGFCDSAKEMQRGGLGVKQTRKLVYDGGAIAAAKCKNCLYELEWGQVEADRAGSETANYTAQGVGFRLRFLFKSHIPSSTVEEQVYGCLFCLQLGRTPEEGDATVFFSQKQLFAHLARHPRPLPAVPGLTVIDADEIPPAFRNDYDLHFFSPPIASQLVGIRRELALLPTATATETLKKVHGTIRRPPGDPHEPLQYAEGARIIGVEFPPRFKGEWAVGWSDGRRSLFPMDTVRLDPPAKNGIGMQQSTSLRVTTRWKFAPRDTDGADWLTFKKGETITNVSWAYQTHWCWSGTNAKGKWGIFPHSHIDATTLLDLSTLPSADAASISSGETQHRSGAGRILSKLRVGSRARPPSTISSSSHETQPPGASIGGGAPLGTVVSGGKPSFY